MSSEMLALAEILASHYKEVEAKDKRIAELEKALATSFEFLSFSRLSDCVFYENHKHLIKEQK